MVMKRRTYVLFLSVFALCNALAAGDDFVGIKLDRGTQKAMAHVQNSLKKQLKGMGISFRAAPKQNLHITLKHIGDLGKNAAAKRAKYVPYIKNATKGSHAFSLKKAFQSGKIEITKNGLVKYKLAPHAPLTRMAYRIDGQLKRAVSHRALSTLKSRNDFPHNGHVTIGIVNKSSAKKLQRLVNSFDARKVRFPHSKVKKVMIFQSNAPQKTRKYAVKKEFKLSINKKKKH